MSELTHVDQSGAARMVDVAGKSDTHRIAVATGEVRLSPTAASRLATNTLAKGDVLPVARVAAIMAVKRTPDLIPLCHPIAVSGVEVDLELRGEVVHIRATVSTCGPTGVEMEALTAVSVAALTVFDIVKAVDRAATITAIQVESKSGGKSGPWTR